MKLLRGFIITITSGVEFAHVGALTGYSLGLIAADNYRMVFRMPPEISIDLAQAGLGLGATQGLGPGILIGLVIVVTVAWYNLRALEIQSRHNGPVV